MVAVTSFGTVVTVVAVTATVVVETAARSVEAGATGATRSRVRSSQATRQVTTSRVAKSAVLDPVDCGNDRVEDAPLEHDMPCDIRPPASCCQRTDLGSVPGFLEALN